MKAINLHALFLMVLVVTFSSCEKEDENPAYVGSWETELFTMATAADTVQAKMSFDFAKTSFVTEVSVYVAQANIYVQMLGVKGSVAEEANQELNVSLTDIGTWNSDANDYNWKNRTSNAAEFEALYQGYLSTSMLKDFDAVYQVDGSNLDLIIAAVQDTINLKKK
jgi:hypothetical protein